MSWWLTITQGETVDGWCFDARPSDEQIVRARVLVGFPAGDGWILGADVSCRVHLVEADDLHASLMARLRLHDVAGLVGVSRGAVETYRADHTASDRALRLRVARQVLAAMPVDELQVILAEHATTTAPKPATGTGGKG